MIRRPPRSTRTDTLFPYTTLFRSSPIHLGLRAYVAPVLEFDFIADEISSSFEIPLQIGRRTWTECPRIHRNHRFVVHDRTFIFGTLGFFDDLGIAGGS